MSILHKAIYRSNTRLIKTSVLFYRNRKIILIIKVIMKMKNKAGGITLTDFKLHYKARVYKTVWYWHKNIDT